MPPEIAIANRKIGSDHEPFFVAAVNSIARTPDEMTESVRLFEEAGADAIKGQHCTADTFSIPLTAEEASSLPWQIQEWIAGQPPVIRDFYEKLLPSSDLNGCLFEAAQRVGIPAISTAFDVESAESLNGYAQAALKVAAPDLFNPELIQRDLRVCAQRSIPFLCSAALGKQKDLKAIVGWAKQSGAQLAFNIGPKIYGSPEGSGLSAQQYIAQNYGIGRIRKLSEMFPDVVMGVKDHSFPVEVNGVKLEGHKLAAAAAYCSAASFFVITAGVDKSKGGNIEAAYASSIEQFQEKMRVIRLAVRARQGAPMSDAESTELRLILKKAEAVDKGPIDIGPSEAEIRMGEWGAISWGVANQDISAGKVLSAADIHFSRINYNRVTV